MCIEVDKRLACDRDAAETKPSFDVEDISYGIVGAEHNWIGDKTVFMALHSSNHRCLIFWGLIVMNNANATQKLERNEVPEACVSKTEFTI
jgi:hypothetical protein